MKPKSIVPIPVIALVSSFILQPSNLRAQGSLTPPGAPAPTMKSLDQIYQRVEQRKPISSAPFNITQPGSYYLTTNLDLTGKAGISISTNEVTIDLNGFTLYSRSTPAAGTAISLNSGNNSDITILNGHITGGVTNNGAGTYSGSGFFTGIDYSYSPNGTPQNVRVSGVSVSGCTASGIFLGTSGSTIVESCAVRAVGGNGIVASVIQGSTAVDCGSTAIQGDQVFDSRGESTGSNFGVYATHLAVGCYGLCPGGTGLDAYIANSCVASNQLVTYKYNMP
jgi:hypothetical protein